MALRGLQTLYNLILKDIVKGSGQASGILSIGKDVRKLADKKLQRYITTAKKQGVDLDSLSEQEIKYMLELNKPKAPQVLSNEEAFEFLNKFLNQGKKGEVIRGKFKPLVTVDSVITDIKKLKPMDSMKETNKVLKGEGKYKNLSKADREKIAGDESVTDHIFERNIGPDPEDFAYRGVAGMLGERPGYSMGTRVLSSLGFTPEHTAAVGAMDKNFPGGQLDYAAASTKDMVDRASNPLTGVASAIGNVVGRPAYDFVDAAKEYSGRGYQGEFSLSPQGVIDFGKNMAILGGEFLDQKPATMMGGALKGGVQSLGTQLGEGIYNILNPEEEDEYDFSDIEGQTAMLNPLALIGLFKSGTTAKGITKTLLKNKIQKEIGKKFIRPKIIKKLKESAGVEFGGTGKFKNISTSNKDYGPYKKSTPAPKTTPAPARPHGNGGGGGRRPDNPGGFTNPGKGSYGPHKASGGRIGFSKGKLANLARRNFMKLLGGVGAGIGALKTGAFKLFSKEGATVAKEVTQVPIKNIEGMPAWFKPLVNKVIKEGTEVSSGAERVIVHRTKLPNSKTDVYVNQDLNNGDVWVDLGVEKHGFASGKFGQPVRLEYKASQVIEPPFIKDGKVVGKQKGFKTKEEFNVEEAEFTGGHPENVKFEEVSVNKFGKHESDFSEVEAFATGKTKKGARNVSESFDKMNEDIADRFSNYPKPDDFASGGLARMLGE